MYLPSTLAIVIIHVIRFIHKISQLNSYIFILYQYKTLSFYVIPNEDIYIYICRDIRLNYNCMIRTWYFIGALHIISRCRAKKN